MTTARATPSTAARSRTSTGTSSPAGTRPTSAAASAAAVRARAPAVSRTGATPGSIRSAASVSSRSSPMKRDSVAPSTQAARLRTSTTPGSSARPSPTPASRTSSAGAQTPAGQAAAVRPTTATRPGARPIPATRPTPPATRTRSTPTTTASPARRSAVTTGTPAARRTAGTISTSTTSTRPMTTTAAATTPARTNFAPARTPANRPRSSLLSDEPDSDDLVPQDEPSSLEYDTSEQEPSARTAFLSQVSPESVDGKEAVAISPSPATHAPHLPTSSSRGAMSGGPNKPSTLVSSSREVTELRKKVAVLERQKEDDRERLRELERYTEDADKFLGQKTKMSERMQDLEQDVRNYETMEKEWLSQRDSLELQVQDLSEQLEMATLDKEVAEEQVELLKEQVEQEKLRGDELQIDLEVLQEQQQDALDRLHEGRTSPGGREEGEKTAADLRAAATITQLERQNEKLKEALIRFRDVTNETDADQRRKITEMDKELASLNNIQAQYEQAAERLVSAKGLIEELKLQLDDSLHAEEMLEELTERNLALNEKVEEMKAVIEDLEALKELNDELEETHIETEKQLQEEIDLKAMELAEQHNRNETLETNVAEDQAMFTQFREVTMQLQSELERLTEEKARWVAEVEGADATALTAVGQNGGNGKLGNQTQAMLNLNMKLQTSILKSQAKTIELELGKLAAQQAQMNIEIIRPYLPAAFHNEDEDAVNALLFFERIRHKADIIKSVIEVHYDIPRQLERSDASSGNPPNETLISICQMRRHLAHFTAVSRQISAIVGHGSTGAFIRGGRMYRELVPVERRIDMYLDVLRKEELKESECVSDLMRFIAQLEDFADALAGADQEAVVAGGMVIEPDAEPDLSAKEVGSVSLFEHDLDTLFASLAYTRQVIAALHVDGSVEWELGGGGKSVNNSIFEPLDELVEKLKAAKVTSHKFLRHLEGLHANTEALRMDAVSSTLPTLTQTSSELVEFAAALARYASMYAHEVKASKMPCLLSNFLKQVLDSTKEGFNVFDAEPWTKPLESTTSMVSTVSSLLTAAKEQDNIVQLVGAEPWLARVELVRVESMRNIEVERKVSKLTDEVRDLYRELKVRDERVQEDNIKIERLNKQLKASREQADQIVSLKHELGETLKQSRAYQDANDALQSEIDDLEKNLVLIRKQASVATTATTEDGPSAEKQATTEFTYSSIDVETSYLLDRIRALRAALQHVVNENAYLKSADLRDALFSLPALPLAGNVPVEQNKGQAQADEVLPLEKVEGEPNLSTLVFQAKSIRKQALEFAASPRMLDITCTPFKPPRSHRKHRKHGHHGSDKSLPEPVSTGEGDKPVCDMKADQPGAATALATAATATAAATAPTAKPPSSSDSTLVVPVSTVKPKRWSPASSVPSKQLTDRQNTTARFSSKLQALQLQLQARTATPFLSPAGPRAGLEQIPMMAALASSTAA